MCQLIQNIFVSVYSASASTDSNHASVFLTPTEIFLHNKTDFTNFITYPIFILT